MKRKTALWSLLIALTALFSCSKDDDPYFGIVSDLRIELAATDTRAEIRIDASSNISWSVSDFPQWIRPDAVTGAGSRTVVLTVQRNDTSSPRTAQVLVTSFMGQLTVTVVQQASGESAAVSAEGGE